MKLHMALIRSGAAEKGEETASYPKVEIVYTDDTVVGVESANRMYPYVPAILMPELRCFDYGIFQAPPRTLAEPDEQMQRWFYTPYVEKMPSGEEPFAFQARCLRAFRSVTHEIHAKGIHSAALVLHQTVLNILMERYALPRSSYTNWCVACGRGYYAEYELDKRTMKILAEI